MLPLIIIFVGVAILFTVLITNVRFTTEPKKSNKRAGSFWTCGEKGCKPYKYGEFNTEKDCNMVCKSFVNSGFGCKLTQGVPWNSYSTLKTCEKHS